MVNMETENARREEARKAIEGLARDPAVQRMKAFPQHGRVSTYAHCLRVARLSCELAIRWGWDVDLRRLARGALLHDYYLYDWHTRGDHLHGYHHPRIAAEKAGADFRLDEREKGIIRTHMWPLTLFHPPTSREGWLVCLADKICTAREWRDGKRRPRRDGRK